jgi:hypothetical protein
MFLQAHIDIFHALWANHPVHCFACNIMIFFSTLRRNRQSLPHRKHDGVSNELDEVSALSQASPDIGLEQCADLS